MPPNHDKHCSNQLPMVGVGSLGGFMVGVFSTGALEGGGGNCSLEMIGTDSKYFSKPRNALTIQTIATFFFFLLQTENICKSA